MNDLRLRFLDSLSIEGHLKKALWWGFIARAVCAYFVYGPQALDDYKHGILPAYQMFAQLAVELPTYRSPLLNWFLAFWLELGSYIGIDSALSQVQLMNLCLGALSLSGIVGAYFLLRRWKNPRIVKMAMYLVALQALMPFLSTRAFGESVACSLTLLGIGLCEDARIAKTKTNFYFGFLILGWACLFRFHVGIIFLSYGFVLLGRRNWQGVLAAATMGAVTVALEIMIDHFAGRGLFETLQAYLAVNQGGAAQYGVMPWYNTWLLAFGLLLLPWSLLFWNSWLKVAKLAWPWLLPLALFILAHSIAPHKEERFLYPIVGLLLCFLGAAWALAVESPRVRLFFTPWFLTVNAGLLLTVCVNNTQSGEVEPLADIQSRYKNAILFDQNSLVHASRVKDYFLRPPLMIQPLNETRVDALWLEDEVKKQVNRDAVVILTSNHEVKNSLETLSSFKTATIECEKLHESSSFVDGLIYSLNPRHNQRRRPTWYLVCASLGGLKN